MGCCTAIRIIKFRGPGKHSPWTGQRCIQSQALPSREERRGEGLRRAKHGRSGSSRARLAETPDSMKPGTNIFIGLSNAKRC